MCPAKDKICRNCNKMGHFARSCRSQPGKQGRFPKKLNSLTTPSYEFGNNTDFENEKPMFTLQKLTALNIKQEPIVQGTYNIHEPIVQGSKDLTFSENKLPVQSPENVQNNVKQQDPIDQGNLSSTMECENENIELAESYLDNQTEIVNSLRKFYTKLTVENVKSEQFLINSGSALNVLNLHTFNRINKHSKNKKSAHWPEGFLPLANCHARSFPFNLT